MTINFPPKPESRQEAGGGVVPLDKYFADVQSFLKANKANKDVKLYAIRFSSGKTYALDLNGNNLLSYQDGNSKMLISCQQSQAFLLTPESAAMVRDYVAREHDKEDGYRLEAGQQRDITATLAGIFEIKGEEKESYMVSDIQHELQHAISSASPDPTGDFSMFEKRNK
jgi:hypothetical protein